MANIDTPGYRPWDDFELEMKAAISGAEAGGSAQPVHVRFETTVARPTATMFRWTERPQPCRGAIAIQDGVALSPAVPDAMNAIHATQISRESNRSKNVKEVQ